MKVNLPRGICAAVFLALPLPTPVLADEDTARPDFGIAGLLSGSNKTDLPPLTLSAGEPLSDAPWELRSGGYYEVEITSDGSQELALVGAPFLRAIWIDEIVIEGLEIRPLGLDSVEFDEAGTMEIGFVAIRPGQYSLHVPGTTGDTQRVEITIK
ncbi:MULTISPECIES: hypothetical protein [unclassified Sulfitobacter]|uniref:hypothetical protein n=1 Tax=unclassified Sulfitobacter TaxID=196795 RepID=UPI0007C3E56B|nr:MULTISPECIES: hypothetical protein [unclassified Sulfitobacter]KZY02677.1 hypothetical protein A3721_04155 [Sulfitobacter sp. HI0023]KZY24256.1 hypothetical protein A3728_05775 [Sulfitobacter sp. HI0040]KZZ63932.1 hypothetical protein A3764_05175 [Sulfitobacter sp. HI0129]